MTQIEIIEIFDKIANKNKWYKINDLAKILNKKPQSITTSLKRLRKFKLIQYRLLKDKRREYEYKHKKLIYS